MMNNQTKMLLVFAVFVLIFSGATLVFWGFVRDTFLIPVYYFLWVSGLMVNSVPQGAYLALLIIVSLIIGAKTIESLRVGQPVQRRIQNLPASGMRYQHWSFLCTHAYDNSFSKNRLALEARKLILSIVAYEQCVDLSEAETLVRNGTVHIPETLRDVIESKYIPSAPLPGLFTVARFHLRRLLLLEDASPDPHVERLIADLIRFTEQHLEITHAGNNPEHR